MVDESVQKKAQKETSNKRQATSGTYRRTGEIGNTEENEKENRNRPKREKREAKSEGGMIPGRGRAGDVREE